MGPVRGHGPDASAAGWRALLRGNVVALAAASLLNDAASEMIYPLLPLFLTGVLGASPAMLGLIEGVAESTASFVKLASGWLSDRVRRRRPLVLAGYAVAAVARPLIALAVAAWQVLVIRFADRIGKGMRSAPRDALLAASVGSAWRGRAFGVHRAADHAGAVIGPLLASVLLFLLDDDLRTVFLLAAIPGALTLWILLVGVREVPAAAPPAGRPPRLSWRELDPPLRRFLPILALFTLGNATDAFLLVRAQQLGVPVALLPALWAAHHVVKMMASVPGGAAADRFGERGAIVVGWAVYALTYLGFAFAATPGHAWALFLVYGLFYGLTEAPEKALVAACAAPERRGAAFGAYHFAVGVAALPASVLFGLIWQHVSAAAAFGVGAALALLAALLLLAVPMPARVDA